MMQDLVGIARVENELTEAIQKLKDLWSRASQSACDGNRGYNPGWHTAIELKHMLTVAEAIAKAARERKESRGGHFREDFPDKSEELGKVNIRIKKKVMGICRYRKFQKQKCAMTCNKLLTRINNAT